MKKENAQRVGEVIEAGSTGFIAQCYELYQLPPLGSLVKTNNEELELYAVVCNATTTGLEPGRRPIARGKDEESEEAIYKKNCSKASSASWWWGTERMIKSTTTCRRYQPVSIVLSIAVWQKR